MKPAVTVHDIRPQLSYVPGLDGLRALAVGAVLLYHHHPALLPGGFLGVELFFVLSGYLITALLRMEWRTTGSMNLGAFWLRRARRLLPAVLVLVVASLALGALFLPDQLAQLRGDALAALGYVTNWRLVLDARPYFAAFERPSLLLHLWSLAIEEQFYLLWPIVLAFGLPRLGTRRMLVATLAGATAATLLMALLHAPERDVSRVYYGTDTRAAALLVGAALALAWPPRQLRAITWYRAAPWRDLLGLLALAALAMLFTIAHEFQPWLYRGGFLLVDLAAAAAILAVARPGARCCRAVLGSAPLRWLGQRSYSIYLWHWPVFVLTRPGLDVPLSGLPLLGLRLALTLTLAELSYRLVETPVRRGALERALAELRIARGPRRTGLALRWLSATGATLVLIAWLGVATASAPAPAPPDYLAALVATVPPAPTTSGPRALVLPTIAPLPPTPAPPPLPVTPISERPLPLALRVPTREPIAPALRAPVANHANGLPEPTPTAPPPSPVGPRSILAVGDSIMLGAAAALDEALPGVEIDAAVSRQIGATVDLLRARRASGSLGDVVIVHLGNNGYAAPERVAELLDILAGVPRVILVNTAVPRPWAGPNNATLSTTAPRYPNVVLVDWQAASAGNYGLFWDDGVHLQPAGAHYFASLIAAAAQ